MSYSAWIAPVIGAYLLGAIPWAYLVAKVVAGIDIRRHGSGNVGTANVVREVGWFPGLVVLVLDASKGAVAVLIARASGLGAEGEALCGAVAAIGHSYPVFLRFRGGKAVATSLGAFLLLQPLGALTALVSAGVALVITRYFSAASLCGTTVALMWTVAQFAGGSAPWAHVAFGLGVGTVIFLRHIPNIQRLLTGTERKIGLGRRHSP